MRNDSCWHVYMAVSFWEVLLLNTAVVDFLPVYVEDLSAFLSSDKCYLMDFSGSRGTISEPYILRFRRALDVQTLSNSNIPSIEPL